MIRNPTVFVLGAGASVPYGLPTNSALVAALTGKGQYRDLVADWAGVPKLAWSRIVEDFQSYGGMSLDFFASQFPRFDEPIRRMISCSIAKCEKLDRLWGVTEPEGDQVARPMPGDWLRWLAAAMRPVPGEDFMANNVRFITFNYDRSLDQFLAQMIECHRRCTRQRAIQMLNESGWIHHVYGLCLPFSMDSVGYEFGEVAKHGLDDCPYGASMKLMRDDVSANIDWPLDRELSDEPSKSLLIFLGFGFAFENLQILRPLLRHVVARGVRVVGSALGMGQAERENVVDYLESLRDRSRHPPLRLDPLADADCLDTLKHRVSWKATGQLTG